MKKLLCLPVLALAVLLMGAPNALADTATCPGVPASPVVGDLEVTGPCFLPSPFKVTGNVKVFKDGRLTIFSFSGKGQGVTILGDLQVEPGGNIVMFGFPDDDGNLVNVVRGNVQIKGPGKLPNAVIGTIIGGDLQVEEGTAFTDLSSNELLNGNLQVFKNTVPWVGPAVNIIGNKIMNGDLQCKENDGPVFCAFNEVSGNVEDECGGCL